MILIDIPMPEIIKQFSSARDHLEQASARVVILVMDLKMFRQLIDPLREQRDLHLGRTCVRAVRFIIADDLLLYFFYCSHMTCS
jgi:hypothetical protein